MSTFASFKSIGIFGSADVPGNSSLAEQVHDMSLQLAQAGVTVVNGGGPGTMLAATQGAEEGNGKTLTISFNPKDAPFFEGANGLNIADRDIEARNYPERVGLLLENSDAFVIFRGGTGTLSEWAMVWLMAHIYYGHHKPFVLVGDFWRDLIDSIKLGFYIGTEELAVFRIVSNNSEVIPALQALESHLLQLQTEEQRGNIVTPGAVVPKIMEEAKSDITPPANGIPVSPIPSKVETPSMPSRPTGSQFGPPPAALPTQAELDAQKQVTDYIQTFLAHHDAAETSKNG